MGTIITEPMAPAALGLIGVGIAAALGLVRDTPAQNAQWALSGFSNTTVWLIFGGYMFTLGYSVTGLGRRIALHLVRLLGGRTLGLGYALTLADLALAPFTASAAARSAGTMYPVVRHIPGALRLAPRRRHRAPPRLLPALHGLRRQLRHEQHVPDGAGAERAGRVDHPADHRPDHLVGGVVRRASRRWASCCWRSCRCCSTSSTRPRSKRRRPRRGGPPSS